MNTKKTIVALVAMAIFMAHAVIFEKIPFKQPTYSDEDPLGVAAITNVERQAKMAYNEATNAYQLASGAALDAEQAQTKSTQATNDASVAQARANEIGESLDEFKGSMTNAVRSSEEGVVVVGSVRGANTDVGMLSNSNSIVFAVDRDVEEMQAESGQILFTADSVKFNIDLGDIYFGSNSLRDLLGGAGGGSGGESNVIVTVKVNGTALVPDADRAIDITIPAAGDVNTIESITTNGVPLPINGKAVELPSIDGKLDATNGVAYGDLKVYPIPSGTVGQPHVIITHESMSIGVGDGVEYRQHEIIYNGESYEFSSDTNGLARLKDVVAATNNIAIKTSQVTDLTGLYSIPGAEQAATNCINAINQAESILEIKTALVDFLQTFKRPTEED